MYNDKSSSNEMSVFSNQNKNSQWMQYIINRIKNVLDWLLKNKVLNINI